MKEIICSVLGLDTEAIPFGLNEEEEKCIAFKLKIKKQLLRLIEKEHARKFIASPEPGVNMYAAEIILDLQKHYPDLSLECVIPFEEEAVRWSEDFRSRYFSILERSQKETLLQRHFSPDCLQKRNISMVDAADTVLFLCESENEAVAYAENSGKEIFFLNEQKEAV